jgi:hypothetical protein
MDLVMAEFGKKDQQLNTETQSEEVSEWVRIYH